MASLFVFFFCHIESWMQKELIIAAVNVIILSEVKIALLRFQFLPRFSLVQGLSHHFRYQASAFRSQMESFWSAVLSHSCFLLKSLSVWDCYCCGRELQRMLHQRLLVAIFPACPRFFWPSCLQRELCLALMRHWLGFPWSRYPRAGAGLRYLDVGTSSGISRDVFAFPINKAETISKSTTP